MEPEAGLGTGHPGRRRRAVAGGMAGLAVAATVGMVVATPRSGAKVPRVAAPEVATSVATLPPVAVAPPTTVALPPPEVLTPTSTAPSPAVAVAPARPPRPKVPASTVPVPVTLAARLDRALAGTPGCLVVEQDGVTVFERDPTASLVPASGQKVMVAAAVLARLGPDYRFETQVVAPARPAPDGRLEDAWLVGGGDPLLATPDYIAYAAGKPRLSSLPLTPLAALADGLVAAGVRAIPGGLHADESRYDTQRSVPSWKPSYVREAEVGSLGALTVNEGLASWGPSQVVAADPATTATSALTRLLDGRGVAVVAPGPVPGDVRTAPAEAVVVAAVRSAPLSHIVAAMLRASDNYAAEMLLRELDHQTGGAGTTAGGSRQVVGEMARAGVATEGVHLNDGSGLDLGNRSTCRALLGALALSSRPGLAAVGDGLAVAGRTGTLATRFVGSPVEGRLAAKTGWLSGVAALVGRIDGQPSRRFALLMNGSFNYATATRLQEEVVAVLATVP